MEPSPTDVRSVEREVGRGSADLEAVSRRVEALRSLAHPGLCVPERVVSRDDGIVVATLPALDGMDLASLVRVRGSLRLGECVGIGVSVANALAAMHARGLIHGDISPANIMIVDGAAVVVDAVLGATSNEQGTHGFAAPERAAGPTPAGDVYALGRVLMACIRGADHERLQAWTNPMVEADPDGRPVAPMVARALPACAPEERVDVPALGVAGEMRAKARGSQRAHTTRLESGRAWRARKAAVRAGKVSIVVALVALVASFAVPRVADALALDDAAIRVFAHPLAEGVGNQPVWAATAQTHARFEALEWGDAAMLVATTAEGSKAREEVADLAAALEAGIVRFDGLSVDVAEVELVAADPQRATVFLEYEVSAHRVYDSEGAVTYQPYRQRVELDLWRETGGWKVSDVRPLPAPTSPPR